MRLYSNRAKTRNNRYQPSTSSSLPDDRLSTAHLKRVLDRLKNERHCSSTRATYHGVWTNFNEFLIRLDYRPPAWEDKIVLYCAHLIEDRKLQSCTVRSYISALKAVLVNDGCEWNVDRLLLSSLFQACERKNDRLKNRLPIKRGLLEQILFQVQRVYRERNQFYLEYLYKTAFMLQYYGLMRIGEITKGNHCLLAKNVHQSADSSKLVAILYSSKTHSTKDRPQELKIEKVLTPRRGFNTFFCPVDVILTYIQFRGGRYDDSEEFLIFQDRRPLQSYQVRKVLRDTLTGLELEAHLYDTHSFRIGKSH